MPGAGAAREGGGEEPDEDLRELGAANTVLRAEVGVGASVVGAHARATSGGGARAAGGAAGTARVSRRRFRRRASRPFRR